MQCRYGFEVRVEPDIETGANFETTTLPKISVILTQAMTATPKDPIRKTILELRPSGITQVTLLGLGNPDVLPLWFGESDLVTPPFIRKAATLALEDGKTFYTFARGIPELREAIGGFFSRVVGVDLDIARITVPGAAMLGVVSALQCVAE